MAVTVIEVYVVLKYVVLDHNNDSNICCLFIGQTRKKLLLFAS